MAWSLAHVIFSLPHACVPWSCCQHPLISQLLQLTASTLQCARERATSLLTPELCSFSSGSQAASKQLSSSPGGQHGPAGEHSWSLAVRDHTWTTPGQALHGHSGDRRGRVEPQSIWRNKSGVVCPGRFTRGCFYTLVMLWHSGRLELLQTKYHAPKSD